MQRKLEFQLSGSMALIPLGIAMFLGYWLGGGFSVCN